MLGHAVLLLLSLFAKESLQIQEFNAVELYERISKLEERSARLDDIEERVTKLEELTKVSTLRSCTEYAEFGLSTTGLYLIDPDGPLIGKEPFQVLCNFSSGSTEVLHDAGTLTAIPHCHDAGCYEKEVTYVNGATNEPIPLSQIDALIQLSQYCEQDFHYECTLAPLRDEELDYAFWTDRHGEKNVYFTGQNKGFHSCDCHFTDEGCFEQEQKGNTCNCDANLPVPLTDSGTITNTTALPVTKLSFGGLTYEIQTGAFVLGNLRCFGKKETEVASSCSSLKLKGTTLSGYYDIKKPGDDYTSLVFCNMAEDGYLTVPETDQPDRSSPLGTIASWISKPTIDSDVEESLPHGWLFCNASLITTGPWTGRKTPDLNDGMFLRGGELGQQLETETDQVQDHQHTDPGHTHSASSTSSPHQHSYSDYWIYHTGTDSNTYDEICYTPHYCSSSSNDGVKLRSSNTGITTAPVSTTVSSHTTGISGVTSTARKGDETRPLNTKVSWIMKCW